MYADVLHKLLKVPGPKSSYDFAVASCLSSNYIREHTLPKDKHWHTILQPFKKIWEIKTKSVEFSGCRYKQMFTLRERAENRENDASEI